MATTNPSLTTTWSKVVDAGKDFLLTLPFSTRTSIQVAISDADEAPTVAGHTLRGDQYESLNRALLGPGYVFAKSTSGTVVVVLDAWTP